MLPRSSHSRTSATVSAATYTAAHEHGSGPVDFHYQIGDLQRRKLRAPQQRVVGDGQERAVAYVDQTRTRGRKQPFAQRSGQGAVLLLAASLAAMHALQRALHDRVPERPAVARCAKAMLET